MHFSVGLALAFSAFINGSAVQTTTTTAAVTDAMPQSGTVKEYVQAYFADEPLLADIAGCESHFRQYDKDGNVLRNPNSSAIGIMQIMSSIHDPVADKLGLDIYTMQGNLAYAKFLYAAKGTGPWNSSKACWGKSKNNVDSAPVVAVNSN